MQHVELVIDIAHPHVNYRNLALDMNDIGGQAAMKYAYILVIQDWE